MKVKILVFTQGILITLILFFGLVMQDAQDKINTNNTKIMIKNH